MRIGSPDPHVKISVKITEIQNEFGEGEALTPRIHFNNYAAIQWKAVLCDFEILLSYLLE